VHAQGVEAVHGREEDLDEALAAGEDHLAGGEEQRGALGRAEADCDGGELLLLVDGVGEEAADGLEVEAAGALELAGADEVVDLGEGGGLGGAHGLVDVVELDEDVLMHLAARELLLARGIAEVFPAHFFCGGGLLRSGQIFSGRCFSDAFDENAETLRATSLPHASTSKSYLRSVPVEL